MIVYIGITLTVIFDQIVWSTGEGNHDEDYCRSWWLTLRQPWRELSLLDYENHFLKVFETSVMITAPPTIVLIMINLTQKSYESVQMLPRGSNHWLTVMPQKTFLNHRVSCVLHVLHEWRSSEGLDPTWEARQSNFSPHTWRSQQWEI